MSKQVMCINKRPYHTDPYTRIQAIGGVANGARWKRAEDDAIRDVERDSTSYYVNVNGRVAWVIVAIAPSGRKYLKTEADGYGQNNLLALPECPA